MKRNSSTLFLISPGATTPVPWVNDAPDFSGFSEPTLSVLQGAWQSFLDSGEPLEIIPDPVPTPEVAPDWVGFNNYLLHDEAFKAYRDVARTKDADINAILIDAYSRVQAGGLSEFAGIWSMWSGYAGLTQSQKDGIAEDAALFNLPADFVAALRG